MPAPTDEERAAMIKTFLKIKRTSLSAIAREQNLAPTTVAGVARGRIKSARIEKLIAEMVGLSPSELWPDRQKKESAMHDSP